MEEGSDEGYGNFDVDRGSNRLERGNGRVSRTDGLGLDFVSHSWPGDVDGHNFWIESDDRFGVASPHRVRGHGAWIILCVDGCPSIDFLDVYVAGDVEFDLDMEAK